MFLPDKYLRLVRSTLGMLSPHKYETLHTAAEDAA